MDDVQIDQAAREMTEGEPSGGFTARVLARIGERQPAPWRRAWMLAPAAAAAIVVLAVVMWRQPPEEVRPTGTRTSTPSTAEVSPAGPIGPGLQTSEVSAGPTGPALQTAELSARPPGPAVQPQTRREDAEEPVLQTEEVAAPPPSELAVEAIAIEPIEIRIAELENMPVNPALVVDDITIEPLGEVSVSQ